MLDYEKMGFGVSVPRLEDKALLTGKAKFLDDIPVRPVLHACFVRSPHAHAKILKIDKSQAENLPGVHGVFVAADLFGELTDWRMPLGFPLSLLPSNTVPFVLAKEEVAFVGEAIAVVLADSRHIAEDGATLVSIEYEVLDAVINCREAVKSDAPLVRTELDSNILQEYNLEYGDVGQFQNQEILEIEEEFWTHRGVAHPIEGRGVLAKLDSGTGVLDVWSSTQMSHDLKYTLTLMLDQPEDLLAVHMPDVGGGFGAKFMIYPEEVVIPLLARKLGKAVKWVEDRRENFLTSIQERDQYWKAKVSFSKEGVIKALDAEMIHDHGAYTPQGTNVPYNAASSISGPYILPNYRINVKVAYTNKVPVATVRGAGYPQAAFVMERLIDKISQKLGLSPIEVREKNFIPLSKIPYKKPLTSRAGVPLVVDSGDFLGLQQQAVKSIDYEGFFERAKASEGRGLLRGIGVANSVKPTGRGPFEIATVKIHPSGRISVYTGALAMGQGIKTSLAQLCAAQFGISPEGVDVHTGDTRLIAYGLGGFASRQAIMAGTSVIHAATELKEKVLNVAAAVLKTPVEELVVELGLVKSKTNPATQVPLARLAMLAKGFAGYQLPTEMSPGLEVTHHYQNDAQTYSGACHVCEVEVDPQTGSVEIVKYVAAQDCGRVINPQIAEAQVVGGVVHGIGNALFEHMLYDPNSGQPLSTTCAEYLLPTAPSIPHIDVVFHPSFTSLNPFGIKGIGECATIPVMAVVISAVENALRKKYELEINDFPLSPVKIIELVNKANRVQGEQYAV